MKVYFVGAGPGDPELLTIRAHKLLERCRFCIYAGSLVSPDVVACISRKAERHDSAKLALPEIIALVRKARKRGVDVVRLHSGDPSIYGAIREQMNALDRLGIPYEVVPGVSSFQAAAAALGTELTAPEVSQTIILTRTSGRTPLPPEQELDRLAASRATLCIFLSAAKLEEIARTLIRHYGADCPAAAVHRASWPDQVMVRGRLRDIAQRIEAAGIEKRTTLFVVGRALARDLPVSKLYDAGFTHGCRRKTRSSVTPSG